MGSLQDYVANANQTNSGLTYSQLQAAYNVAPQMSTYAGYTPTFTSRTTITVPGTVYVEATGLGGATSPFGYISSLEAGVKRGYMLDANEMEFA